MWSPHAKRTCGNNKFLCHVRIGFIIYCMEIIFFRIAWYMIKFISFEVSIEHKLLFSSVEIKNKRKNIFSLILICWHLRLIHLLNHLYFFINNSSIGVLSLSATSWPHKNVISDPSKVKKQKSPKIYTIYLMKFEWKKAAQEIMKLFRLFQRIISTKKILETYREIIATTIYQKGNKNDAVNNRTIRILNNLLTKIFHKDNTENWNICWTTIIDTKFLVKSVKV